MKSTGTGTNWSMSNLSTPVFSPAKSVCSAKLEVSACVKFLDQFLLRSQKDQL